MLHSLPPYVARFLSPRNEMLEAQVLQKNRTPLIPLLTRAAWRRPEVPCHTATCCRGALQSPPSTRLREDLVAQDAPTSLAPRGCEATTWDRASAAPLGEVGDGLLVLFYKGIRGEMLSQRTVYLGAFRSGGCNSSCPSQFVVPPPEVRGPAALLIIHFISSC